MLTNHQVMSHASRMPWAVMPEDVKNKIAAYGDAIVSNWVPQQQVLDHPVGSLLTLMHRWYINMAD